MPDLGIANSVYKDQDFNPLKTIQWAHDNGFNPCQIYLNHPIMKDMYLLDAIRHTALKCNKTLLVHAPHFDIFEAEKRKSILGISKRLLKGLAWKTHGCLIWHIHPDKNLTAHLRINEMIVEAGLCSCPENFHLSDDREHWERTVQLTFAVWSDPCCIPVLDLPRLFSTYPKWISINLAERYIHMFNKHDLRILHVIDGTQPLHNRTGWKPIMTGELQWNLLLRPCLENARATALIFEYEDRRNPIISKEIYLTLF
ncbi:hypothetical protein JW979_03015 [bacterium]|nr:hypothetical protein [candidate division CSSED10-310 bacterium]